MQHYTYLLVNLSCAAVPFLFSFHPAIRFYLHWKGWLAGTVGTMLVFIPWDVAFTRMGVWGFNPEYVTGKYLADLPLEEWMFFIAIPYACVFTYHCFRTFLPGLGAQRALRGMAIAMALAALATGLSALGDWYTAAAHLACATLLILHLFVWKSAFIPWFVLMYIVILVPFIISNGVLTGLQFWQYPFWNTQPERVTDQVVWYNNTENLGLRIFSMPLDDLAYGLTMLLLNVGIYERYLASRTRKEETA